jgi:hypothetical protein
MSQQNYKYCYCCDNTGNNLLLSCGHYLCKACICDYIQVINDDFQVTCSCSFITFADLSIKSIGNVNILLYNLFLSIILFIFFLIFRQLINVQLQVRVQVYVQVWYQHHVQILYQD